MLYLLIKDLNETLLENEDEYYVILNELKEKLLSFNIDPGSLDPYDAKNGIAIRGELDYIKTDF